MPTVTAQMIPEKVKADEMFANKRVIKQRYPGTGKGLVHELSGILAVEKENVRKHPDITDKNPGEVKDAKWE
ncbi:MAG: hypothetical protein LBU53_13630 [Zoogloeaceae bacterium]|jgi:hypothetical protein|nr:hypothetical protein [Zoogloeaceae bacterium]